MGKTAKAMAALRLLVKETLNDEKTFSSQFCWEEHCKEDARHSSLGRPLCSSVGKSIAKRILGTVLWEDLLIAVLLGRALQRGYPAQLFAKTFSLQFCWEEHCKEDTGHSSLGRLSHCSSVGRALQRGFPGQLFGKTFSLQFCWEEHCEEDTRNSSLGRPFHRSSVGKSIAKRLPGTALLKDFLIAVLLGRALQRGCPAQLFWEDFLFAVLLGRALQRGYPAQLFGKTFSLQFCWEERCKEDTRRSSLGRHSHCSSVGKIFAKRIPGTALWEDLLFAVLLGRALQRGYPAQLWEDLLFAVKFLELFFLVVL